MTHTPLAHAIIHTSISHHQNTKDNNNTRIAKKKSRWLFRFIFWERLFIILLVLGIVITTALGVIFYRVILKDLPSVDKLKGYGATPLSSHIYDRNGELLFEIFKDQNRTAITLDKLPKYVPEASIAIEDKDFYKHKGVSFISGVLRGAYTTYIKKQGLQGGSTITQQLVKKALLYDERTWVRKLKEIVLAVQVEQSFTKKQILEMYLNQIPYGGSAYGIEEAANQYFNVSATQLSISQAALLAGLPQAPSKYNPTTNQTAAIQRRNTVLKKMLEQGYITLAQYDTAAKELVTIQEKNIDIKAPHFVFYVKEKLIEQFGEEIVAAGGLRVDTTLDLQIQEEVEKTVAAGVEEVTYLRVGNGAALVVRPVTGEILAMVGSKDYFQEGTGSFNVTTALRQPGSSIKPINYAVGLDRKIVTAATFFLDVPTCFQTFGPPYCPKNYDGTFHGPTPLRYALGNSNNIAAVKMLQLNGVENFIASSSAFLIQSFQKDPSRYGLSLTLGGGELQMIELVQAYSALANRGKPRKLNPILKVTDPRGRVLYELKDKNFTKNIHTSLDLPNYFVMPGKRAISEEAAWLISHILADNNARTQAFGPNSLLRIKDHPEVSVKTGTTDEKRDNWTVGYTPNFLVAVWVGNNDNSPMNQALASGVTGAAPIWHDIMAYILENQKKLFPIKPDTIVGAQVCPNGRMQSETNQCTGRYEYFIKGTQKLMDAKTTRMQIWINRNTQQMAKQGDPDGELQERLVMVDDQGSIACLDCATATSTP